MWIRYQLVGAYDDQQITLECHSEAYPKSINYWTRDNGDIIPHSTFRADRIIEVSWLCCQRDFFAGSKYVPEIIEDGYKVHMKLSLNHLGPQDYGIYKCISKNSLGDMEGTINIYSERLIVYWFCLWIVSFPGISNPALKNSSLHFKSKGINIVSVFLTIRKMCTTFRFEKGGEWCNLSNRFHWER